MVKSKGTTPRARRDGGNNRGLLSQTAQYALRIMSAVACVRPDEVARSQDLALSIGAPPHYVSKVLRTLVRGGLLVAVKGHGGGFQLARPPEQISFRDILWSVDPPPRTRVCVFGWKRCDNQVPCILHKRWRELTDKFDIWAAETTLAEIRDQNPTELTLRKMLDPRAD